MALLNHLRETPPDGFTYTQAETGVTITGDFLGELEDRVIAHRQYKGLAPTDRESVTLEIQRQICSHQFPGVCYAEKGENYVPLTDLTRSVTPNDVMGFTASAFEFIKQGGGIVDKQEAERRAAICRGCPMNRSMNCICTPVYKLIDATIPAGRKEPGLLVCGICACSLAAKILMPASVIQAGDAGRNLTYAPNCWIPPLVNPPVSP